MLDLPAAVEKVVRHLREDILRGRLRAGERLPSERELSERIGVHRGAVREARRTLAQLGLVEIGPGGARVAPVAEASLDVVEHLLALDELPDPFVVAQIMEAAATIFAGAALLFVERAEDPEIERARALLARFQDEGSKDTNREQAMHDLVQVVIEGSGNFVLGMIGRNLKLQFSQQLEEARALALHSAPPAPLDQVAPIVRELDDAFAARQGESASRLIHALFRKHRERVVGLLEAAHAQRSAPALDRSSLLDSLQLDPTRPSEGR